MLSGAWCGEISGSTWSCAQQHVANADADLAGAVSRGVDEMEPVPGLVVGERAGHGQAVHVLFRVAVDVHETLQHRAADAGLLEELVDRLLGHGHPLFEGRENPGVELVDGDFGLRHLLVQEGQPAEMIDVAVGDDNAADVVARDGFAEFGADLVEPGEQLLVGVAKAAASVDQGGHAGLEQQVHVHDKAREGVARNAIDAHSAGGFEAADFRQHGGRGRHKKRSGGD